jgi:hypothetical protein
MRWVCSSLGKVLLSMIFAAKNMPAPTHGQQRVYTMGLLAFRAFLARTHKWHVEEYP